MSRAFTVNAWRFSISGLDGGKWDQFCKFGEFDKSGEETAFNADTCAQILENFAARTNDIGMDFEHQAINAPLNGQPAPALAWYDALALVVNGKVAKLASHNPAIEPPDPAGKADGIYGHRAEVTPLGQQMLPNYRYISPAFVTDGKDEQGNPIGYDLLNVAATNIPFLDGMEPLSFYRFTSTSATQVAAHSKGAKPMDELMAKLGLSDASGVAEYQAALKKMSDGLDEMAKKYAEGADEEKKKEAPEAMADADKDKAACMDDGDKKEAAAAMADDDEDGMHAMCRNLGLPAGSDPKAIYAAMMAKLSPITEVAALRKEIDALKAAQAAKAEADERSKIEAFVDDAIAAGKWDAAKKDPLVKLAKLDFKAAEEALLPKGTYSVLHRMTNGTAPKGTPRESSPLPMLSSPDRKMVVGADFADKAKAYAKTHGVSLIEAQRAVAKQDPGLAQAYLRGE